MDLKKIKSISNKNIDRLVNENLYRGFTNDRNAIMVQCMNKDMYITFDFVIGAALIEYRSCGDKNPSWEKTVNISDKYSEELYNKIKTFC